MSPLRLVSLGAGEQSTALALMSAEGILGKCDGAVFADTGWEPAAVYEHLERLTLHLAAYGFPVHRVSRGNIRDDALDEGRSFAKMPLYSKSVSGKLVMLQRQCTADYKVAEVHRKVRELLGERRPAPGSAEMWIGISTDEALRMKPTHKQYVVNRWPLIERGMSRDDCRRYNESRGFFDVPKSACIGCPFTDRARWRDMKLNRPEEFADAVAFERDLRRSRRFASEDVFLTRSAVPLDEVDFRSEEDAGQLNMFDEECLGMCGV